LTLLAESKALEYAVLYKVPFFLDFLNLLLFFNPFLLFFSFLYVSLILRPLCYPME